MCFHRKTPPGFALHSKPEPLPRQWCQKKSSSSVWCMHLQRICILKAVCLPHLKYPYFLQVIQDCLWERRQAKRWKKKNPNRLSVWVSWQGLVGRAFLHTPSWRCRISLFPLCSGGWPHFVLPPAPTAPSISLTAWRTLPLGTSERHLRHTPPPETRAVPPAFLPPLMLTCQFRNPPGRITHV